MVPCRIAVFFELSLIAWGSQWPAVQSDAHDALPNVELSLAPPLHIWPQVAAALGSLEERRETMENANMDKLQEAFNAAMVEARHKVGDIIGRMMRRFDDPRLAKAIFAGRMQSKSAMFRELPQEALGSSVMSVKVNVLPASPPDAVLKADIDNIELQRYEGEKHMFEAEAFGELRTLTKFILNELEVQMQSNMNSVLEGKETAVTMRKSIKSIKSESIPLFLQKGTKQLPEQANVRIVPMGAEYPTVVSMVQDMESRRDITEKLEMGRILEKELDLVMVCNNAMEEGLKAAVARILAQYGPMVKSLHNPV